MSEQDDRPRTHDALRALPVGPSFGTRTEEVNGKTVRMMFLERQPVAIFHGPTDPISWVDEDGAWSIGRYSDGTWFKVRK